MAEYTIQITDRNLNYIDDPIINWTTLDVTLRYREPGSGYFEAPGYDWIRRQLAPGNRVVINRGPIPALNYPGEILIAGPIEEWLDERADDGENAGDGKLTVHFADDFAWIAARCVYPNPAKTPDQQDIDSWTFTGNGEVAIRALVDANAGPGALAARRVPGLVLGALSGVGGNVTVTTQRMQPLPDVLRDIADAAGGLGFRTKQVGQQVQFEVYQPPDVSGSVRFGFRIGNMKYLAFNVKAPTVTAAIVGGQGEGADRALIERSNDGDAAAWGRFEKLTSRPGTTAAQTLQDDGDRALAEGAPTRRVSSNVVDNVDQTFGVHYQLGSIVALETTPGQQLTDIVQTVHMQAWPTAGEVWSATVGSQADIAAPRWVELLRQLDERLGTLERSAKPATVP